jgi:uncharacterized pyridoxamine 5'-phosphate oxidase family protein
LDFVAVDTEGWPELSEIAILDSRGQLIYEAFAANHPNNHNIRHNPEIEKLNHSSNGQFVMMEPEERVNFDLIYNLIIDIQEKDLEVDLAMALPVLTSYLRDYWLIAALSTQ